MFEIPEKNKFPTQGCLLISEPFLNEVYFQRSCICIVKLNENQPVVGLVLNKPLVLQLSDVIKQIPSNTNIPLFCGGPLSMDRLFYIHSIPTIPHSVPICNGLFFNGDFNAVIDYINSGSPVEGIFKFFLGYSGWEYKQLLDELNANVWAVENNICASECLLPDTDDFWERNVKNLGTDFRSWLICPVNPHDN